MEQKSLNKGSGSERYKDACHNVSNQSAEDGVEIQRSVIHWLEVSGFAVDNGHM